jgi:hypothetical protein
LDHIKEEITQWERLAENNPYEVVSYEAFVANREDELNKALGFLGLDYNTTMGSELRKINPDNLRDVIDNYDEVVSTLTGTRYEQYLELK